MSRKIQFNDFKLLEFSSLQYFFPTYKLFGLLAALVQISPLVNLIVNYEDFIGDDV